MVARQASTGAWRVFRKDHVPDGGATTKEKSLWLDSNLNHENGKEEVRALFGCSPFDFPKSRHLIQRVVALATTGDDPVMDCFAGSGTTGDAVIAQNIADGATRRYLLVQLPEPLDPANPAQKTAAELCDTLGRPRTIAELTKERLRRAGATLRAAHPHATPDTGFRAYRLAASSLKP
nr:DNA methyltransferase [Sphingomonas sp. CFBP 13720]